MKFTDERFQRAICRPLPLQKMHQQLSVKTNSKRSRHLTDAENNSLKNQ